MENLAQYESSLFDDDHTVPMHLIGSPFYVKVWKALLEIPMGHASTYSGIALRAGNVRAVRAVGTAIGKKSNQLADPVPSGIAQGRQLGRISLGAQHQTRDAGL